MQVYRINGKNYYLANEIKASKPHIFKGCSTPRAFANKQKLSDNKYTYARLNTKKKWTETDGSSCKFDKLFLRKKWFDEKYLSKLTDNDNIKMGPDII